MAENREVILANFQACTGLDDVGEAIFHLEEAQWDLVTAVNRVMPQDSQEVLPDAVPLANHIPPNFVSEPMDESVPLVHPNHAYVPQYDPVYAPPSPPLPLLPLEPEALGMLPSRNLDMNMPDLMPSTSRGNPMMYTFKVRYGNTEDTYEIPEHNTIGSHLKNLIYQRTNVAPACQLLTGWDLNVSDNVLLKNLGIPREMKLLLASLAVENDSLDIEDAAPDPKLKTYVLNVTHEKKNSKKTYRLSFPGSHTILQIKNDVYTCTDIPARHQMWIGWPIGTTDRSMLHEIGVNSEHCLTVTSTTELNSQNSASSSKASRYAVDQTNHDDSDASSEEFEDASASLEGDIDHEIFIDDMPSNKLRSLVPADASDEMAGAINFGEEFNNRYGSGYPSFYPGSLEDAIKDSCLKPARDRKLLAMYIHNDKSVLSNVFCTQLLGAESVRGCLSDSFVVWGWDTTHPSNKIMFLNSVNRSLGNVAGQTIGCIPEDKYPILVILMRNRNNTEIFRIVHGNIGVSELLTCLLEAIEVFQHQQSLDLKDEEERAARELIKVEQDRAYQASLAVDRAKEESKKQQEMLEEQERERSQREKEEMENLREAQRQQLESQLPPEPQEGAKDIIKIRYKLPDGGLIERRFLSKEKLKYLLDFLTVKGYPIENYKVITYPRRDVTSLDQQLSLAELKLCPQETMMVEER
ncbi:FAS-associated factor 1 [Frankliniella fusca]|uniref:FAS-associated factor 1 n=1 Tax=Frankliniella fusca TaxID=407009 RepID=A0AAE1LPD2_9NEOP|nr:FAS-associated factor 1 [Frankliniella fusca]